MQQKKQCFLLAQKKEPETQQMEERLMSQKAMELNPQESMSVWNQRLNHSRPFSLSSVMECSEHKSQAT